MQIPEGVRCETCDFFDSESKPFGADGWCNLSPSRELIEVNHDEFCGHHPLWQEIARREAAQKLDGQKNCG